MQRAWIALAALLVTACDDGAEAEVAPAAPAASKPTGDAKAAKKKAGPPLAKDDPRFNKPYVPKPKKPLDFSGVDVGDAPMADAAESMDALGQALVEALNAEDGEALAKLALTETEYKERFFPITINHPNALKFGADLSWSELHGESKGDMKTALERYGGQSLTYVRIDVKEVAERPKATLHRRPTLVVKNGEGNEMTLVMLGSILEHAPTGGFKVLAYRDTR
ncbi:MAG: hypothetical protein AAGA54_26945 [Myxococcota bacterium]